MADTVELEITYLAKRLPEGLDNCRSREILDIYLPESARHPTLRVRRDGGQYMVTKKEPLEDGDTSRQLEQTIRLTKEEFDVFSTLQGKRVRKQRYFYRCGERMAEIDVFKDGLEGLVFVDFEFGTREEKNSFSMPEFCLADVTQEEFLAGGLLCGKGYSDIEQRLSKFNYSRM